MDYYSMVRTGVKAVCFLPRSKYDFKAKMTVGIA